MYSFVSYCRVLVYVSFVCVMITRTSPVRVKRVSTKGRLRGRRVTRCTDALTFICGSFYVFGRSSTRLLFVPTTSRRDTTLLRERALRAMYSFYSVPRSAQI